MPGKDCVAMILAGGQGSRLGCLTKLTAKPVIPFGGKYKIIDFTLSNCVNSGIHTVGVLTQYQPHELSRYIGSGQPWDLDRYDGGVYILPPYVTGKSGEWYKGTANAIYQNIAFIEGFKPRDVLILSSDHIYIMDYRKMIDLHREMRADASIAVIPVPWEEASRLGIVSVDATTRIDAFVEKPRKPPSNLASMGIYVFKWDVLKRYLIQDEKTEKSSNDFGKNIIPTMLADGARLYAQNFQSYWKDVGTVESLWRANMDLLEKPLALELYDDSRRIYCRNAVKPPHYISVGAKVSDSLITEGCDIYGDISRSVLSPGVYVGSGSKVTNSVIFQNVRIGSNCVIDKAIISDDTVIDDGCTINDPRGPGDGDADGGKYQSEFCSGGISLIASGLRLGSGARVQPNSMVETDIL
ncbi:MAG: glucose-1-phosphate adenylyltransferase [Oscillospiraceae bacterium]|nr:glucose-1-phosphate adenylyltransferase [Oscillospiraceae bacterium]